MSRRRQLESWQALERLATAFRARHLRALYAADPGRADRYVARAAGLTLEYGRQRVDDEILAALGVLAEDCRVREGVEARPCTWHCVRRPTRSSPWMAKT